jgi:hypothetical protein
MPLHAWQTEPNEIIRAFEIRFKNPEAGALIAWSVYTVESLYYLDDLDSEFDNTRLSVADHRPDVIDVAHARWATTSCITSLDLCAAALGRAFCGNMGDREYDLGYFNQQGRSSISSNVIKRRIQLPPNARKWLDDVFSDPDYEVMKLARDWLTHSRVKRHFELTIGSSPQRLKLGLSTGQIPIRDIIELTRDLATKHVAEFLNILSSFS